jgi:hypothetical protein
MMMISLVGDSVEVASEVEDLLHSNQVVLEEWEVEWENLLASKQLLKTENKKLLQKKQKLTETVIKQLKLLKNTEILVPVSIFKINISRME